MRLKTKERSEAIRMRKFGKTIPDIAQTLRVSKASVSLWLRGIPLSRKALRSIALRKTQSLTRATEAKKEITANKLEAASKDASQIIENYKITQRETLIMASLMYWCEGTKSKNDSEFTFTNADPLIVAGFLSLLRTAIPIDESRFRVKMHLHPYHSEREQKRFWSRVTAIPKTQFQNVYWKKNSGVNMKSNYQGCVHIRYHDVTVARKISAIARNFLMSLCMIK